jgi:hypothetical protein
VTSLLRISLASVGAWLFFVVLVDGYVRALEEVAGKALADHSVRFCPNWLLGLATGAFGVGLAWWVASSLRRRS